MDQSIYDAALDLGCNQWQAFYKVVIHELMPGIFSGLLMSLDVYKRQYSRFVVTDDFRRFARRKIKVYGITDLSLIHI